MDYYLSEKREVLDRFDYSLMPLFRPALSYEVVYGRLQKLLSLNNEPRVRQFVIYCGSCPFERISILRDRIIASISCVDTRKKSEIEQDFFYESRSRRTQTVARSRISNDWFSNGNPEAIQVEFVPRMHVRGSKRNCKKRPM